MNKRAFKIIKEFEGLSLTSYVCPAGYLTIGYGHRIDHNDPQRILLEEAQSLLEKDIATLEKGLSLLLKVSTNENQMAAFLSFSYNLGLHALSNSTLLKLHNQGRFTEASEEFGRWTKARINGELVSLKGLVRRRAAEKEAYLLPVTEPALS